MWRRGQDVVAITNAVIQFILMSLYISLQLLVLSKLLLNLKAHEDELNDCIRDGNSSDLGSNFTSELNREFERRLGCSPRFNSPYHPNSTGLAERGSH